MKIIIEIRERRPELFDGVELIYDAEAIFARREIMRSHIAGQPRPEVDPQELLRLELDLACKASRVLAVSENEIEEFRRAGATEVNLLAHAVDISPRSASFETRQDFLFVGRLAEDESPNVDSVVWFVSNILPLIGGLIGSIPRLFIVGKADASRIKNLASSKVIVLGELDDLEPWYDCCRVFVVPTRFAAGISLKVCEAAAAGIPVVGTDLVFTQLGWQGYSEFMGGNTAEKFAMACADAYTNQSLWYRIREIQSELVQKNFSRSVFSQQLSEIFGASCS